MSFEEKVRERLSEMKGDGTLAQLSDCTGVSVQALSRIIRGERGIGPVVIEQLRQNRPEVLLEALAPEAADRRT